MGPHSPSSVFQSLSSDSEEPNSCPKRARLLDQYSSALLSLQQRRNPYEQQNEFQNQTHPLFALSGFQTYSPHQILIAQKPQIRHSRISEIFRVVHQKAAIAMEGQSPASDLKPDSPSVASSALPQIFAFVQQRIDSLQSIICQISQTPPPFGRDAQQQLAAAVQISSAISQLVVTAAGIALPPSFSSDLNPSLDLSPTLGIGNHFLDSPIANLGLIQSGGFSPFDASADVGIAQFIDFQDNSFQGLELGINEGLNLCNSRAAAARGQNEQVKEEEDDGEVEILPPGSYDLIEMDAMEILAEHTHFCEICGKGFKRDANLRMHMRGHGDEYKSPAALARPQGEKNGENHLSKQKRFSCPFEGCKRNKLHKKFQPLKTVLCVKNHYRRTHCPKILICSKCKIKRFSVVADLKTHEKHCGKEKWQCSCGTTFSRKDKLIGHLSLFEGHLPAPGLLDLDHQINQVSNNNSNASSSDLDHKSSTAAALSGFNSDLGSAWRLNTAYHNSDLLGLNTCNEAAASVINNFPDLFPSNLLHGTSK